MGIKLNEIITSKEISLDDLKDKKLMVDSFNILYQFLSTLRMRDGSLLTDSQGRVTSHLLGLFNRTTKLMQKGIKLGFIFDGKPPELKVKERERRAALKKEAQKKYEAAAEKEDVEAMKKYASRTTVLTEEMINEAKEMIKALGLPIVQAPSEGEAQAAYIVNKGEAFAVVSQDFDCLMFGVPKLVRNLTISERRKMPGKLAYTTVKPEMIDLSENLNALGIDQNQLIALSMLIGTDYNVGGIKGIGPKNALKLVKKHGNDFDTLFKEVEWDKHSDQPWSEVYYFIKKIPTTDDYEMGWRPVDYDKVKQLLCEEHDFSPERVDSALKKLMQKEEAKKQKGLGEFI
jgi:flap endonuclease-1